MKQSKPNIWKPETVQPPSGGCVLKHADEFNELIGDEQPPSGGCVLKLFIIYTK